MDLGDSALAAGGACGLGPSRARPCVPLLPRACTFPRDSVTTGFRAAEPRGKVAHASARELIAPWCLAGLGTVEYLARRPAGPGSFARSFDWRGLLAVLADRG